MPFCEVVVLPLWVSRSFLTITVQPTLPEDQRSPPRLPNSQTLSLLETSGTGWLQLLVRAHTPKQLGQRPDVEIISHKLHVSAPSLATSRSRKLSEVQLEYFYCTSMSSEPWEPTGLLAIGPPQTRWYQCCFWTSLISDWLTGWLGPLMETVVQKWFNISGLSSSCAPWVEYLSIQLRILIGHDWINEHLTFIYKWKKAGSLILVIICQKT